MVWLQCFKLRGGLRWSNGDALTAEHFAAGLRRARDPETAAPNAGLLADITHVEVIAPEALRLRLRRPVPYLPAVLALPIAAPSHPRAGMLEPTPVNGAYRLVHRVPGARIELERKPYYWNAAGVAIYRVVHVAVTDPATEVNLYRTGELDLTSEVPNAQLASLQESLPGELRLEGVVLFIVLWWYSAKPRPTGAVSALFLIGYGTLRFLVEFTREPDGFLGLLALGLTMGQWLSLPMVAPGAALMVGAGRPPPVS